MSNPVIDKVMALARDAAKRTDPVMRWTWGQALFGFALAQMDAARGTEEFTPFLTAFCDHHVANPPRIDYADTVAPALITFAMQQKTGNPGYQALTSRALDYIRHEPRLLEDAVNHLGHSAESRWYPKSLWVDSLMMFGVFPALYGRATGDRDLLDFAARQVLVYQRYLQDKGEKLWYHSYWVKAGRTHPKRPVFWARGNGWVLCALPWILDSVGAAHPNAPEIRDLFAHTTGAVLAKQNPSGGFSTILNKPSYEEMSATALISAGVLHGVRKGYISQTHREAGEAALRCVVDRFTGDAQGLHMTGISAPTIPLPLFPAACYRLTPRRRDLSYGLAAVILAGMEQYLLDQQG